jgi:hypothetical protein
LALREIAASDPVEHLDDALVVGGLDKLVVSLLEAQRRRAVVIPFVLQSGVDALLMFWRSIFVSSSANTPSSWNSAV